MDMIKNHRIKTLAMTFRIAGGSLTGSERQSYKLFQGEFDSRIAYLVK